MLIMPRFTFQSQCYTIDRVDESYEFLRLQESMRSIGFCGDIQRKYVVLQFFPLERDAKYGSSLLGYSICYLLPFPFNFLNCSYLIVQSRFPCLLIFIDTYYPYEFVDSTISILFTLLTPTVQLPQFYEIFHFNPLFSSPH